MYAGLGLLKRAASATHRLAGVAADRTGIGLRALVLNRKAAFMADATCRTNVLQALYVLAHLAAKLAFDSECFCKRTDLLLLVRREILALAVLRDTGLLEDISSTGWADAKDKWQRVEELLVIRKGNAGDTHRNGLQKLALTRLTTRVTLVDSIKAPASADNDVSRLLDLNGCAYFHRGY